jgi:hypothetical protein
MDGLGASNIKPSRFAEEVGQRILLVSVAPPTEPRLVTFSSTVFTFLAEVCASHWLPLLRKLLCFHPVI